MAGPHEGRPPHPQYGAPLSGQPHVIQGVTFRPYRLGVSRYARISDDFRIEVRDWPGGLTYRLTVDGVGLPFRFRTRQGAVRRALKIISDGINKKAE